MQDRKHGSVGFRIQELIALPGGGKRACLRLAVAHDTGGYQIRIIEYRSEGMGQGITELAALVDGAGSLGGHMAGDAAGEGELLAQLLQAVHIFSDVGIHLAVGTLQIRICHEEIAAVAGTGYQDHILVIFLNDTVQMYINKILPRDGSPVPHDFFLHMLQGKGLAQKGVVQQVKLRCAEVVGGAPVGIHLFQIFVCKRLPFFDLHVCHRALSSFFLIDSCLIDIY